MIVLIGKTCWKKRIEQVEAHRLWLELLKNARPDEKDMLGLNKDFPERVDFVVEEFRTILAEEKHTKQQTRGYDEDEFHNPEDPDAFGRESRLQLNSVMFGIAPSRIPRLVGRSPKAWKTIPSGHALLHPLVQLPVAVLAAPVALPSFLGENRPIAWPRCACDGSKLGGTPSKKSSSRICGWL